MNSNHVIQTIAGAWWVLVLRGVLAILFGVSAFLMPGLTVAVLALLWGAYALVDGLVAVVGGVRARWWSIFFFGLVSIAAGVITFLRPDLTALALLFMIGIWAVVRGVLEIAGAIRLRREISNEWLLILSGLASILFGAVVIAYPGAGALAMIWWIAAYAIVIGILLVMLGFRVRKTGQLLRAHSAA